MRNERERSRAETVRMRRREQAQKRVEQHNFQIRKRTLEYDDVMNKQREIIYGFRNEIIHADDVRDRLLDIMEEVVIQKVTDFTTSEADLHDWKFRGLADWVNLNFPLGMPESELKKAAESGHEPPVAGSIFEGLSPAQFAVCNFISEKVRDAYNVKVSFENPVALKEIERFTILNAIDKLWQEHLYEMDSLRYSIGLRAHGQRDPLIEYKAEAFKLFDELMTNIKGEIVINEFGVEAGLKARAESDPDVIKAVELLPQAKQLADNARRIIAARRDNARDTGSKSAAAR